MRTLSNQSVRARGVALLYIALLMPFVILGMITLAVDVGVVQSARASLQAATDATALHAAQGLADGTWQARGVSAAGDHAIQGAQYDPSTASIVRGSWDESTRTFTPNSSGGEPAVQVRMNALVRLPVGTVLGFDDPNVVTSAVVRAVPNVQTAAMQASGNLTITNAELDTWNSNKDPRKFYQGLGTEKFVGEAGGDITLNNVDVRGDLNLPAGQRFTQLNSEFFGGGRQGILTKPIGFETASVPGGVWNIGSVSESGGTYDLPGGRISVHNLTLGQNVRVRMHGPTEIYVTGTADISCVLATFENKPANLKIINVGTGQMTFRNKRFIADIFSPRGNVSVIDGDIYGRLRAKNITMQNANFCGDENLAPQQNGELSLVQ